MTRAAQVLTLDCPTTYRIEVQGYLDENRSEWMDGMAIVPQVDPVGTSVTTLTGLIVDQAALHGLLRKLYVLGLPLLSVNRVVLGQVDMVELNNKSVPDSRIKD